MPAMAPLPEELVKAHPKDIGQFLVSSGPYQWEGMADIDIEGKTPPTGMDIGKSYVLERNPAYDPATDDLRPAYLDRIEVQVGGEVQDLLDKVDAGAHRHLHDLRWYCHHVAAVSRRPALEDRIKVYPSDGITYTGLNVFQPPMDDIHIRKAHQLGHRPGGAPAADRWTGPGRDHEPLHPAVDARRARAGLQPVRNPGRAR